MKMIKTFTSSSFSMDYIKFGKGTKPLIVLPGISLFPVISSYENLQRLFSRFCDDHTVYVFERRNNLTKGFSVEDMTDDMAVVMEELNLYNSDIYGASQGGMIALILAAKYPHLVSSIVAASSLYKNGVQSSYVFSMWLEFYNRHCFEELNRSMFTLIYSDEYFNKYRNVFEDMIKSGTDDEFLRLSVLIKACLDFDATAFMEKISCPVLAIGSTADRVIDGQSSKEIAEKTKNGSYYLYNNYGHAVYDEEPEFLTRVYEFYKNNMK